MALRPEGLSLRNAARAVPLPLRPPLRRVRDLATGRWPRQVAFWSLSRTSNTPETFTEKILWRMAYDRRPILTQFADKVAVRDYVADRVGEELLTHLHGVYSRPDQVDWAALPREYVCKASHGSGGVVLVWDGAIEGSMLPANAGRVEWDRFVVRPGVSVPPRLTSLMERWLGLNFEYGPGRLPEWAYRDIPPRVIFEELLAEADGSIPRDFKFYVFDDVVQLVQIDTARFGNHVREFFRSDGTPVDMHGNLHAPESATPLPDTLPRMIEIATELGGGMDFVRVDLYDLPDRIAFGELTTTPGGGAIALHPRSFDVEFGSYWTLPTQRS